MQNNTRNLLFFFGMMLLLLSFTSATMSSYEPNTRTVTLNNNFLFIKTAEIATVQLVSPLNNRVGLGYQQVAELKVNSLKDYNEFISSFSFTNMKTKKDINRNIEVKVKSIIEVSVDDYTCPEPKENLITSKTSEISIEENTCYISGSHLEKKVVWTPLTKVDIKKDTVMVLGLFTNVEDGDYIDWIPTIAGKQVPEWATWTADLNTDIVSYWKFDETSGDVLYDSLGTWNGTNTGAVVNVTGLINTAYNISNPSIATDEINLSVNAFPCTFLNEDYSLSVWINPQTIAGNDHIIYLGHCFNDLFLSGGVPTFQLYSGESNIAQSSSAISTNEWHHIIVTRSTVDGVKLYVNGNINGTNEYTGDGYAFQNKTIIGTKDDEGFDGIIDELGIWSRALSSAEVTQLYNNSYGISYTTDFSTTPAVTQISPDNDTTEDTIGNKDFVCYGSDGINFTSMEFYFDGELNQTNSTGLNNTNYTFTVNLNDGDYNWSCKGNNNGSVSTETDTRTFSVNTIPFIEFVSPTSANGTNLTTPYIPVNISLTETYYDNLTINFYKDGILNESIFFDDGTRFYNKTGCTCANWEVNATVWTSTGQTNSTETRFYTIDIVAPTINITSPLTSYDYLYNNQTIDLNYSITDTHLDSCWSVYNGTITEFNCSENTTFQYITGVNNITVYANDTFGNEDSLTRSWTNLFQSLDLTYDIETYEGIQESFGVVMTLLSGGSLSQSYLQYNDTNYTTTVSFSGGIYTIDSTITIPSVDTDVNQTFSFWFSVGGAWYNLLENTQSVFAITLGACGVGDTVMLNLTLLDEKTQASIIGDIELNAQITNKITTTTIESTNLSFTDVNYAEVCLTPVASYDNFYLNTEIRYEGDTSHVPELYNIVQADLGNYPSNLSLYDLATNESTEFLITYKDDNFIEVADAIVQLRRKYIAEDAYKVVEAPLTSAVGTAVVHVDLNAVLYSVVTVKDGEILNTFDNLVFNCENELSGVCTADLKGEVDPENIVSVETIDDFSYVITEVDKVITTTFAIPSGTSAEVLVTLKQIDAYGNETLCNQSITSSGGSLECEYIDTISQSNIILQVTKDGELMVYKGFSVAGADGIDFLGNNYFIVIILLLSVVGMAFTSPEWTIILSVLTFLFVGGLYLLNGVSFATGIGGLIWLVVAAIIIITKLSKQEDR